MTQAVNPESGTTCYTYDDNGNLSTRQQAGSSTCSPGNGVLTSYNYDYLNRLTSKVMPEGNVTYTYDQRTYGRAGFTLSATGTPLRRTTFAINLVASPITAKLSTA